MPPRPEPAESSLQVPPRPTRCGPRRVRCCPHSSGGSRSRPPCPPSARNPGCRLAYGSPSPFPRSATGHSLQVFGVPSPLHLDLGGGAVDFPEVVGRQFNSRRPEVLLEAIPLG